VFFGAIDSVKESRAEEQTLADVTTDT